MMMAAKTSLDLQLQRQQQWRFQTAFKNAPVADELLRHEFSQPEDLQTIAFGKLQALLNHCYEYVPYYREQMQGLGLYRKHLKDPGVLSHLPLLDKQTLGAQRKALKAQTTMRGQRLAGQTQTSGTTGEPTLVDHSDLSLGMFNWLKQRELRWFGWDPVLPLRPSDRRWNYHNQTAASRLKKVNVCSFPHGRESANYLKPAMRRLSAASTTLHHNFKFWKGSGRPIC